MSRAGRYARFVAMASAVVAVLLAVGFLPTRRLAGDEGIPGMAAGCLIGLAGAALAGWLLVAFPAATPTARMQRALLAMTIRLAAAVMLALAVILSSELARIPLLFWLATTYVVLLPLEVKLAVREH
jgi:hypothetical protein